jgi:hypothetical protein
MSDLKIIIAGIKQRIVEVEESIKNFDYKIRIAKELKFDIERGINFDSKTALMERKFELKEIVVLLEKINVKK